MLYRRRQRRRAVIGWSTLGVVVALIAITIAVGDRGDTSGSLPRIGLFTAEMTSGQYRGIHKGEEEALVDKRLGSIGLSEQEVGEPDLLRMFPPPPLGTVCSFWKLSDAPDHLVRLCFGEAGLLQEKAVRAPGEGGAETTLA